MASTAAHHEFGRAALTIAGIYATLVLGAGAVVAAVVLLSDDPGLVGVWSIIVSAPTSFLFLWLTEPVRLPGPLALAGFEALCIGAGLLQAWAMWRVFRGRRIGALDQG